MKSSKFIVDMYGENTAQSRNTSISDDNVCRKLEGKNTILPHGLNTMAHLFNNVIIYQEKKIRTIVKDM